MTGRSGLRRLAALAADSLIMVLAVLGVAGSHPGRASVLLLGLALLGVAARLVFRLFSGDRVALGTSLAPRSLVAAGTAVELAAIAATRIEAHAAVLAAAILVVGGVAETYLRRAARFRPPFVALPGIEAPPPPRDLRAFVLAASVAATAVGLALVATTGSAWWFLAASVAAQLPSVLLAKQARERIVFARRLRTRLPAAVAAYEPEFVLYTSRPDDASYQVTMWLPYLKRTGQRFLIVTRNAIPAQVLAELTDVPVVQARRLSDLDAMVPPSLKAAFYVNASSGNGAFVRYQHLTHVYLGHGDSDKPPSYNPTHAMYDRIFAAGRAATRRYADHGVRIPPEKFQIVGRPQVEGVQLSTRPISAVDNPVVLYAPTWRGHVEETLLYSLPVGNRIVEALLQRGVTVIFRPHPFSYAFADDAAAIRGIHELLENDAQQTGRRHLWGVAAEQERGIFDCINASDAMVSDVSSVVSDYLYSTKPFAMVAVPAEPAQFVVDYPVARAAYVIRGDLRNLQDELATMLTADGLAEERRAIRADYLGDFPVDSYSEVFVDAVRAAAREPERREDEVDDEEGESTVLVGGGRRGYRRLVVGLALRFAPSLLAVASLAAAVWPTPIVVALLLASLSQGQALRALRRPGGGRARIRRVLRLLSPLTPRAVLLVLLAEIVNSKGELTSSWGLALVLLTLSLAGEAHIRTAWARVGLQVHDLPAVQTETPELLPHRVVPLVSSVTILALLVLAALHGPAWLALALSVVLFVVYVDAVVRALLRTTRVITDESRLRQALVEYAPQFAMYFASPVGAAYQIGMWLPYMVRIGRPFIIVTRHVSMMREIAALTERLGLQVPIIQRPTLRSLEDVIVEPMTTSFYVNNAVRNAHFVERRELTHVWLNHGDSEKPACYNPVHAIYDLLFAAGQAGIDRYGRHGVQIPEEKFRIVGRPQVESIEPARQPIAQVEHPTVLYAPTWQGPFADTRVYSLPLGRQIVEHLLARGVRVIFRAHPFNYRFRASVAMITDISRLLAADRAATGRQHVWGQAAEKQMTIEECFNASDAMVSDVSAVVSDYLRSDKPFAIVSVGRTPEALRREAPAATAGYVIRQDLDNLDAALSDLLGADPLAQVRSDTKVYYLGDFGIEHYAEGFLDAAREVIDAGRGHRPAEVDEAQASSSSVRRQRGDHPAAATAEPEPLAQGGESVSVLRSARQSEVLDADPQVEVADHRDH